MCRTPVWGQNAVVSGPVTDTSRGVIKDVTVELTNRATQVNSTTLTNAEGIFIFPSVPPGAYAVSARITGFTTSRIESVTLEVGQSKTLNIIADPGDVEESVTLSSDQRYKSHLKLKRRSRKALPTTSFGR